MTQWGSGWGPGGDPFGGQPFGGQPFGGPPQFGPSQYSAPPPPPQQETNTFATLSVIFAFLFAPAGAVFGHLGLNQIKRTGQPGRSRAIAGLTLSYTITLVAIVAVIVAVTVTSPDRSATTIATSASRAPSTSAPTTTTMSPSNVPVPPTPSSSSACAGYDAPPQNPGRTFNDNELSGLLLEQSAVEEILSRHYSLGLTAQPVRHEPVSAPYPFGTVTPSECMAMVFAGTADAYRNSSPRSFIMSTLTGPNNTIVIQAASTYSDSDSAYRALTNYTANLTRSNYDATYAPSADGSTVELLLSAQNFDGADSSYVTASCFDPNNEPPLGGTRWIFQRGNLLIDISAFGVDFSTRGDAQYIAQEIEGRFG